MKKVKWLWSILAMIRSWFTVWAAWTRPEHGCHTNLSIGEPLSLSVTECAVVSPVVRGLGTDPSPPHGLDMARKWHNIKNKKQICLCPSRLPRIKRLSFQRRASRGLATVARRPFPFLNTEAAGTSPYPPLLFDLVSPERMSFLLSAPECSGKQGPGRTPAVMLI